MVEILSSRNRPSSVPALPQTSTGEKIDLGSVLVTFPSGNSYRTGSSLRTQPSTSRTVDLFQKSLQEDSSVATYVAQADANNSASPATKHYDVQQISADSMRAHTTLPRDVASLQAPQNTAVRRNSLGQQTKQNLRPTVQLYGRDTEKFRLATDLPKTRIQG